MPRPITPEDRIAMADLVRRAIQRTLLPDAGVTLSGQPVRDFLAGPAPASPFSAIQWGMGRETCRRWASGRSNSMLPSHDSFMRDTCTPFIEQEYGPVPDGAVDFPFQGGQCPGEVYGANYQYFDSPSSTTPITYTAEPGQFSGGDIYGPIASAGFIVDDGVFCGGGNNAFIVVGRDSGGGAKSVALNLGGSPCRLPGVRVESLSFVKLGGGPECGDPSGDYDSGGPVTGIPGPAPVPAPPGAPWPFPRVDITFNPDGTIGVDFGDDTPPLTIDPGQEDTGPSGPPAGGGDPGPPSDTGLGDEAGEDAPEGEMLWGLRIGVLEAPSSARQYAPGVYRGACYVYMGDSDGLDHDPAGAMLRDGQFVLAERDYLTRWRVAANPGYNLRVTPYYKPTGE